MDAARPDPPARHAEAEQPQLPRATTQIAREEVERPRAASPDERATPRVVPGDVCDWASVRAAANESRRQVKMVVEEAIMLEFKDGCVSLKVAADLMTAASGVQEDIRQLISRAWGRQVRLEFAQPVAATTRATQGEASPSSDAPAAVAAVIATQGPNLTVANATDNPLIAKAVELFGAKVLGVYPRQK